MSELPAKFRHKEKCKSDHKEKPLSYWKIFRKYQRRMEYKYGSLSYREILSLLEKYSHIKSGKNNPRMASKFKQYTSLYNPNKTFTRQSIFLLLKSNRILSIVTKALQIENPNLGLFLSTHLPRIHESVKIREDDFLLGIQK